MPRALFEKTGDAVYISHLDLMRLFQRGFQRAGLPLTHTQGFNQRPSVSIALPLSLGMSSQCELLDFALAGESVSNQEICQRLNRSLVPGVRVKEVYDEGRKIKHLAFLRCQVMMEYDAGVPAGAVEAIDALFRQEEVLVEKKSKNRGLIQENIIPMIQTLTLQKVSDQELWLDALICCQNPTLNPMQLVAAIETYLPAWKPDFVRCHRVEIFDQEKTVFR